MTFIKSTSSIDLGDTPIENIFIDVYMPMANGTYVKVYLLGYKYACDRRMHNNINNMTLASNLNIPLSDVMAAWDFWEEKKIIKKIYSSAQDEKEGNYKVEFLNLKQLYIDNNYRSLQSINREEMESPSYACSPGDLLEANKVPEIQQMFIDINKIINRSLVPNEKMKILEWFHDFNIDPPLAVKAYSYCRHKRNISSVNYVEGVIRNWYDLSITNVDKLQEYLEKQGERYGAYGRIFRAMGYYREPTEAESKLMDKWIEDYKFTLDIILRACDHSSKTSNPHLNYIDGILTNWYNDGVRKLEDIDKLRAPKKKTVKKPSPKAPRRKTRFHLTESRGDKYEADELEELLLQRQKNK